MIRFVYIFFFLGFAVSCANGGKSPGTAVPAEFPDRMVEVGDSLLLGEGGVWEMSPAERKMKQAGFVDIAEQDTGIRVQLKYATPDNFTGKLLYKGIKRAFMHPLTAAKLTDAQKRLNILRPGWHILVYDAARPMSVQLEMWEEVKGTKNSIFVSNPAKGGGLHNYGMAVDVSLVDAFGKCPDMGTSFDYFGEEARTDREEKMVSEGKISREALQNRKLLRKVMTEAGFIPLKSEWWHFNTLSRQEVVGKWPLIK